MVHVDTYRNVRATRVRCRQAYPYYDACRYAVAQETFIVMVYHYVLRYVNVHPFRYARYGAV
jgi:hypothetical protein